MYFLHLTLGWKLARSINKVTLLGNDGKDPEIRSFQNEGKVANSACDFGELKRQATGEKKAPPEWHNIVVLNEKLVKIVEKYVSGASDMSGLGSTWFVRFLNREITCCRRFGWRVYWMRSSRIVRDD